MGRATSWVDLFDSPPPFDYDLSPLIGWLLTLNLSPVSSIWEISPAPLLLLRVIYSSFYSRLYAGSLFLLEIFFDLIGVLWLGTVARTWLNCPLPFMKLWEFIPIELLIMPWLIICYSIAADALALGANADLVAAWLLLSMTLAIKLDDEWPLIPPLLQVEGPPPCDDLTMTLSSRSMLLLRSSVMISKAAAFLSLRTSSGLRPPALPEAGLLCESRLKTPTL